VADDKKRYAFISYIRENKKEVDRLCDELAMEGVHVWLDRDKIQPGVRWKYAVQNAIRDGKFFIACFSNEYSSRDKNFMNEELTLAIEQLRQYSIDRIWFIPVLFSECKVPALSIGGGETLLDLNWVSLYENWNDGIQRILDVIKPIPLEIQEFIQTLRSVHPGFRKAAAEALGKIGDPVAVPALIAALGDEDFFVSLFAGVALAEIGPAAVPALLAALNDQRREVRIRAVDALWRIDDPVTAPALIEALSDEDSEVRSRAADALEEIKSGDYKH
jgi:hypothetical protein